MRQKGSWRAGRRLCHELSPRAPAEAAPYVDWLSLSLSGPGRQHGSALVCCAARAVRAFVWRSREGVWRREGARAVEEEGGLREGQQHGFGFRGVGEGGFGYRGVGEACERGSSPASVDATAMTACGWAWMIEKTSGRALGQG